MGGVGGLELEYFFLTWNPNLKHFLFIYFFLQKKSDFKKSLWGAEGGGWGGLEC